MGTVVRPQTDEEFLQEEDGRECLYRKGSEEDIHFVGYVDLVKRHVPERAESHNEAQDRNYAEDLEEKIERMVDAGLLRRDQSQEVVALWSHIGPLRMSGTICSLAVKCPTFVTLVARVVKDKSALGMVPIGLQFE